MRSTRSLASAYQPLIRFLGKRTHQAADHAPAAHPASPTGSLPSGWNSTFASYRQTAQQHGPLGVSARTSSAVGSVSGQSLGPVKPDSGVHFDRSDLPARFSRLPFSAAEIEAVESGGASLY